MKGDIALAGFVLTAEEWAQLDSESRTHLLAIALTRDEPWASTPALAEGSGPIREAETK